MFSSRRTCAHVALVIGLALNIAVYTRGEELNTAVVAEDTLTFGISLALHPPAGQPFKSFQTDCLAGLEIWRDWWNALPASNRTRRYGPPFKVELAVSSAASDYTDTPANRDVMFNTYRSMASNRSIDYLFGPIGSPWGVPTRNFTYYELGVPIMLAAADSSEAYYSIPGTFGSSTANVLALSAYLPYLRVAKARTLATIQVAELFPMELCRGVLEQAALNSLEVVSEYTMAFDYTTFGTTSVPGSVAAWYKALDEIIAQDVDALFICDYGDGSELALKYLREKNWVPKSVTLAMYFGSFTDPSLLNYVTTISAYDPQSKFPVQQFFTDSTGYNAISLTKTGREATSSMAKCTLAGMLYTGAIQLASDNSTDSLLASMRVSQFSSFMGTSAFDTRSRQTLSALVLQYTENATNSLVIGPALAAAESLIYPMPSWEERVFAPKFEANGTEIASLVLIVLGGVTSLGWAIFLFIFWRHRVVFAASPIFLLTILLGSILVYISIFTWMPNIVSDSICNLRAWLLPLGFMTMFGSLIAKTYRIHKLYNSRGVTILIIRNGRVALYILAVVGVQAIISVLMVAVTKLESKIHVTDVYRVSLNYKVCTFSVALKILFAINVVYAFVLLVFGTYLAYRIRKVPISIYDESKIIAFSIYNTAFFGVIVIVIQLAIGNSNRHLTFMVTAVCCFLGAYVTVGCLFAAKVWAMHRPTRSSSGPRETTSSGSGVSSHDKSNAARPGSSSSKDSTNRPRPRPAQPSRDELEAKKYKNRCKKLKLSNQELGQRIIQLENLAREHGFLVSDENEEEMSNV